jgi:hypothetical protein
MEAVKPEKNHPVFTDGLKSAYLKYDVRSAINGMQMVLSVEEKTKIYPILLSVLLRNLA